MVASDGLKAQKPPIFQRSKLAQDKDSTNRAARDPPSKYNKQDKEMLKNAKSSDS